MASASETVIVDLNIGGVHYTTALDTLTSDRCMQDSPLTRLAQAVIENDVSWPRDNRGEFRYIILHAVNTATRPSLDRRTLMSAAFFMPMEIQREVKLRYNEEKMQS
jgi:hypothetical protein